MDFISQLIQGAAETATGFGDVLVNAATAITDILYVPGADGGLTIVGAGLAMALGVGAVYLLFRLVRGLVKVNERG